MSILRKYPSCPCCGEEQAAAYKGDTGKRVRCSRCTLDVTEAGWADLREKMDLAHKRLLVMRLAAIGLTSQPLRYDWQDALARALQQAVDGLPSEAMDEYNEWVSDHDKGSDT